MAQRIGDLLDQLGVDIGSPELQHHPSRTNPKLFKSDTLELFGSLPEDTQSQTIGALGQRWA